MSGISVGAAPSIALRECIRSHAEDDTSVLIDGFKAMIDSEWERMGLEDLMQPHSRVCGEILDEVKSM